MYWRKEEGVGLAFSSSKSNKSNNQALGAEHQIMDVIELLIRASFAYLDKLFLGKWFDGISLNLDIY